MPWSLTILLLLLIGALAWLVGRPGTSAADPPSADDDIDSEMLDEAEAELRDLDALASPDDAEEELPDWGPGAPKS